MNANQLRAYNAALHEARTAGQLRDRSIDFLERHRVAMPPPDGVKVIRAAHRARVSGDGCPADCDAAMAKAIREIGQ